MLFVCFACFVFGQDPDKRDNLEWKLDMLSVLIGLVVGAFGGFLAGKRGGAK